MGICLRVINSYLFPFFVYLLAFFFYIYILLLVTFTNLFAESMLLVIGLFLVTQILYHFFVTFFWYWLGIIDQSKLALIRDWLWILIVWCYCLYNIKYWKDYLKNYWKILGVFVLLLIFWFLTSYLLFHKSFNDILIGVKYWVWWMIILISSTAIGFFMRKRNVDLHKAIPYVKWGLISVLIFGWIWQWLKLIIPDFFYSMGYGKLDDFHYWENPPIYYLTWYEWDLRWQGIFSWPNNYWYFLVLFFPIIFYLFPLRKFSEIKKWERKDWLNCIINLAWILSIIATLSRAAVIWLVIILILLNIKKILKHKKVSLSVLAVVILALIWLSCMKRESTIGHIQAKWDWIQQVINQPLWYGLGSSWPAVHHSWMFLPENYYLQLMLDLGTVWFLIWCWVLFYWIYEQKKLRLNLIKKEAISDDNYQLFITLQRGILALLVMALFLHVFEDSMVNYLFFVPYWILLGYLSCIADEKENVKIS